MSHTISIITAPAFHSDTETKRVLGGSVSGRRADGAAGWSWATWYNWTSNLRSQIPNTSASLRTPPSYLFCLRCLCHCCCQPAFWTPYYSTHYRRYQFFSDIPVCWWIDFSLMSWNCRKGNWFFHLHKLFRNLVKEQCNRYCHKY